LPKHELQAPAKINLFLAVTGRRADGFHDLLSVAAPLDWGDTVSVELGGTSFTVSCDDPEIPVDGRNLVLRAAEAFALETGSSLRAHFSITKRIPSGAGLGGASSDAVAALRALNAAAGKPLDAAALARLASGIGSDCALFLAGAPVVMRGRGERAEALPTEAYRRIRGVRVLLFKPSFPISTAWSYAQIAAGAPRSYVEPARAEARLAAWLGQAGAPAEGLLFNSMEGPAFAKYPALPVLLEQIRYRFGLNARMSGSGSACYVLLQESFSSAPVEAVIREALGPAAFMTETRIA
jgi:4-diphosphocytidyl-2-C-methyl-D-erythritol kinase